jgi:hypothetical protein
MRHLDPEDTATGLSNRRGQPIDRGYDVARRRHHGKSDAPFDHPLHDRFRDGYVIPIHRNSAIDQLGVGASGRISLTLRKSAHSPGGIG